MNILDSKGQEIAVGSTVRCKHRVVAVHRVLNPPNPEYRTYVDVGPELAITERVWNSYMQEGAYVFADLEVVQPREEG